MFNTKELDMRIEPLWSLSGDHFIRLEFNLVLIVLVAINAASCKFRILGWLIDVVAGVLLYYGTYSRKKLLNSVDWTQNVDAAMNADGQVVESYLVLSMATWIASTLFEVKSCLFLLKIDLGSYRIWSLSKKSFFFLVLSVVATGNACWMMLLFTSEVHQSFECITQDKLLLTYFCMAALAKNGRVFLQGLVFSSRIAADSWEFLSNEDGKREMMSRMAFSNVITLRVILWIVDHYHIGEPWTPKLFLTFLSVIFYLLYHLVIIVWFIYNSPLKQTLLVTVPGIFCTTVRGCIVVVRTRIQQAHNYFNQLFHVQDGHAHPLPPPPLVTEERGPSLTPDKNELVTSKYVLLPFSDPCVCVTNLPVNLHSTEPQHMFQRYELSYPSASYGPSTSVVEECFTTDFRLDSQHGCDKDSPLWRQCKPCQDNDHKQLMEAVVIGKVCNVNTVEKSSPVY